MGPHARSIVIYSGMMGPHAPSMKYIYTDGWAHMLGASSYIWTDGPTCSEHEIYIYGRMGPHARSIVIYTGMMGPHAPSMKYIYTDGWAHMLGALSYILG